MEDGQKIKTSCKECIFKIVEHDRQLGCQLGRIKQFLKTNRAHFADNSQYYIIDGVCNTCRGEKWKIAHRNTDLINMINKEIEIGVDIVIYSIDETDDVEQNILYTVSKCAKQYKIKPKKLIIVTRNKNINYKQLHIDIQQIVNAVEIPFRLVRAVDYDTDLDTCVGMGIEKCTSQFTAVFDTKHTIVTDFIHNLNTMINKELKQIVMVKPTFEYGGLILQTGIFKALAKNYAKPIFEKVVEIAEEQGNSDLIYTWEQLCPNHQK